VQTVVFDFFGVICSEIAPFVLPRYMSAQDAVRFKATVVQDADLGFITQDEMFARLSEIAHVPAPRLAEEFWSYAKIDPATVALIEKLRERYRTALLTNAIVPFIRQLMARENLERLFDIILVSAEEHLVKPDAAYFRRLLERTGAAAGDCVFLDDNPANVEGARAVGIAGIVFASAAAAAQELKDRFGVE
jgi:HAD superfamily hydrolase (TIGR01509 family)